MGEKQEKDVGSCSPSRVRRGISRKKKKMNYSENVRREHVVEGGHWHKMLHVDRALEGILLRISSDSQGQPSTVKTF